jgi:hypothetical protein
MGLFLHEVGNSLATTQNNLNLINHSDFGTVKRLWIYLQIARDFIVVVEVPVWYHFFEFTLQI